MRNEYSVGRALDLQLTVEPLAFLGTVVLFAAVAGITLGIFSYSMRAALAVALAAVVLHWVAVFAHQLGHALAARRTGHPMSGIGFGRLLLFSTSLYPPNEPTLPSSVHFRRALGGPIGSIVASLVALMLALALWNVLGRFQWLAAFFFFDNLFLVATSFMPLSFTDGSVLYGYWRE